MKTLKAQLTEVVMQLPGASDRVTVEYPVQAAHGDYSTNIAMIAAKEAKKNPMELAEDFVVQLKQNAFVSDTFETVEAVKPGFINFSIKEEVLTKLTEQIIDDADFGKSDGGAGKKVQVEFISANPTGPLTLGNGRGGTYGGVLANVLDLAGHDAQREYYINDAGNQVKTLGLSLLAAAGAIDPDENYYKGDYIQEWVDANKDTDWDSFKGTPEELGNTVAKEFLEQKIKPSVEELGVVYDNWFSEKSELHDSGAVDNVLSWLREHDLVYEQEGAQWMKTEQYGDEKDRVVVTSDGDPTYFLADVAYHKNKFDRGFEHVINVWGADHHGYINRMLAGVEAIGHKGQLEIVIMQLVRLMEDGKEVRMSKRKGTFVTLQELIDEVGVDATRWFFLMRSPDTHMDFDLTLAKEKSQKNPVYYVQYAYTRLCSILKKAEGVETVESEEKLNGAERALMVHMLRWPEVVAAVSENHLVHSITEYAYDLAERIQKFYEHSPVIVEGKVNAPRLTLVNASQGVLRNALDVLGISAPESM